MLICAGGTGGGVYPAFTVLEALNLKEDQILWVGGRGGMEEELVTRHNLPFTTIPAAGVHGVGLRKLPGNILELVKGFFASLRILRQFNPNLLLFTGGFVAVPMAAAALNRPSLLYVPDIEPGMALKALAHFADRIALTTESSKAYFPNSSKLSVTGYPVRPGLTQWTRDKALQYFDFDPALPTLTVMGGSKGARSINNALIKILPVLLEDTQIIHLTGYLDWELIEKQTKKLPSWLAHRYQAFPYLHEMGAALAAPNLIISRAGASVLGEYPLFGLPAILVPYPHAWRYQYINASYLVDHGAAVILRDEDLESSLLKQIQSLIADPNLLTKMSTAMAALTSPNAAQNIANLMYEMVDISDGGFTA